MHNLPDRRVLIRWMFNGIGLLLIFGHDFTVHSVLRAEFWAGLFFGEYSAAYAFAMALAYLYLIPTALVCWAAASGLKREKRWGQYAGVVASALLLPGFPWLTVAGALGLYVLLSSAPHRSPATSRAATNATTDFWAAKRKSKVQPVVQVFLWFGAFSALAWLSAWAKRAGMPAWNPGAALWLWFVGFMIVQSAVHEWGHAIVAWAVGYKVRIISVGPFTFWREYSRIRFRFDLGRLIEGGGYMGAVPVSDEHLRFNQIAVVAAGPATNALLCLVLLCVFFSAPGAPWQNWWWLAALNAVIACMMTAGNLIPFGYCDGTMLLHLILWTSPGRLLVDRQRVMQMGEEADAFQGRADFDHVLELREAMLKRSLAFGPDNAFVIAVCHQTLGSAHAQVDDWPSAEFHYRKCLDYDGDLAGNLTLAANAWSGLQIASVRRGQAQSAADAYAAVVEILTKQKSTGGDLNGPGVTMAMLAQAHLRGGDYAAALPEIERAFKALPRSSANIPWQAHLYRFQASCYLYMGDLGGGLESARCSAEIYRSDGNDPARRNLAWENLADLGDEMARAGQCGLAEDLLHEGITNLGAGGAAAVSAQYRIKLAGVLRQLGRLNEAFAELPAEEGLSIARRRALLTERAQLHLASGRHELASADCRELIELWRAHPCGAAPEIAAAEALLAKASPAGEFSETAPSPAGAAAV